MKQLLVYDQPVALNRSLHRRVRIKPGLADFRFSEQVNSVPLTVAEFADAARHYPIVFSGTPADASMPAVLLGLEQDGNWFVQADGRWEADTYIPAFLRRYPFVVAQPEQGDRFTVCVDRSFISEADDAVALFDDGGADTPALTRALTFLSDYQQAVERTQAFMAQLRDCKLLIARTIRIDRPGEAQRSLQGFCVVDETKLQKLGAKALAGLSRTGALGLLYVHLASLGNVQRLARRMNRLRSPPAN